MKKLICLIVCFCLVAAGCSKTPAPEIQDTNPPAVETAPVNDVPANETTEATIAETIPALAYQNPYTAVSLIPFTRSVEDSSGTTLYSCSSSDLTVTMNDHTVASGIAADFQLRMEAVLSAAKSALDAACEDYEGEGDWTEFFCNFDFDVARIDQMTLSFVAIETFFDGTPLSGQTSISMNYDMQTGAFLALKDILTEDFSADTLIVCILNALSSQADQLFEDYIETITGMFDTNTPIENWYLSKNGLCFHFSPYEIAPPNRGIVRAEIPYEQLVGILKDEYFPAETVEFSGNLIMHDFSDANTDSINQFAEVILDDSAKQYLLYPQGTVLNVRVEIGTWTKTGAFVADSLLFSAEALTSGNALMIQLEEADLGKLCITYQTGQEIIRTPWQNS